MVNHPEGIKPTVIDLLRHGACEGGDIFRGVTDVPLSELGWQQLTQAVADHGWDHIVTSPLQRCHQFAQSLAKQLAVPLTVDARWQEVNFGVWEGRDRRSVWAESGDDLCRYFSDPACFTPENGEPYHEVNARVSAAWQQIIHDHLGQRILVIGHGGIIRTLYGVIHQLPSSALSSLDIPYGCMTRWRHYPDVQQASLVFHHPLSLHRS